jgi:hypothetical protein
LVVSGLQYLIASQVWYIVSYTFDGTTKSLTTTGLAAWQLINGALLFNFVSFGALLLSRGVIRTVLAWVVLIASAGFGILNIESLLVKVPPVVNSLVEKASGIAGSGAGSGSGSVSDAIQTIHTRGNFTFSYAITVVILLILQIGAAAFSKSWTSTDKHDKYVRATANQSQAPVDTEKTAKNSDSKGDNIALWDSQR